MNLNYPAQNTRANMGHRPMSTGERVTSTFILFAGAMLATLIVLLLR